MAGLAGNLGSSNGTGSAARFDHPFGTGVNGNGNAYVADNTNDIVRQVTPGGVVTTLAGSAGVPGSADGTGSAARFNIPTCATMDGSGGVILSNTGAVYNSAGSLISTTIAPSPLQDWGILSYTDNVTASGTALTVDVLNSSGILLASNVGSGTDLSTIPVSYTHLDVYKRQYGGSSGEGTVFKVTTGGVLTVLVNFNSTNGSYPSAQLILGADGNYYGNTYYGGTYGDCLLYTSDT